MKEEAEIFEALKRTAAYEPATAPEAVKFRMLASFWRKNASELRKRFGETGLRPETDGRDEYGFGYLVEGIARESGLLPQNSEEGKLLEGILLEALQNGGGALVGTTKPLRNPDMIWVERRNGNGALEITGIGEVKSSVEAYLKKPEQIKEQESSIRQALDTIAKNKASGTAHRFFEKRELLVREPFWKVMIVPAGSGRNFSRYLPGGWEMLEIEFSYDEMIFLAQKLWPGFRKDVFFKDGLLGKFEREFLPLLFSFKEPRVRWLYKKAGDPAFPAKKLVLFACATGKLPSRESERDLALVDGLMKGWRKLLLSHPEKALGEDGMSSEDRELSGRLAKLPLPQDQEQKMLFVTHIHALREKILARQRGDNNFSLWLENLEKCENLF